MSDVKKEEQEKQIQDETLDKVSGGAIRVNPSPTPPHTHPSPTPKPIPTPL
jgi:hypothetical protein